MMKQHTNVIQAQLNETREDLAQLRFKHSQEIREMHNNFERKLMTSQESFLNDITHFRSRISELTRTHEEEVRTIKGDGQNKIEQLQAEYDLARKNFEEQIALLRETHEKSARDFSVEMELQKLSAVGSSFPHDSRFEQK